MDAFEGKGGLKAEIVGAGDIFVGDLLNAEVKESI
jgi:hypothetical protein